MATAFKRTIVAQGKPRSEQIAPGVKVESLHPGGLAGPNGEVLLPTRGGQTWSDFIILGGRDDAVKAIIPDIRLPANQYWPMHWHDCWTVVLVLEGSCLIGDWWMEKGDVFITTPSLEYGPLVIGPTGCRMFEIFSNMDLSRGGYGPEYHDHPTLNGVAAVFADRSDDNKRNAGNQSLSCDADQRIVKTSLTPGVKWDLGDPNDPERSVLRDTRLAAGETLAPHSYGDWHTLVVLDGSATVGGHTLQRDDYVVAEPGAGVAEIVAGADGVQFLELARTARGDERRFA